MTPPSLSLQSLQIRNFANARAVGNPCEGIVSEDETRPHVLEERGPPAVLDFLPAPRVEDATEIEVKCRRLVLVGGRDC